MMVCLGLKPTELWWHPIKTFYFTILILIDTDEARRLRGSLDSEKNFSAKISDALAKQSDWLKKNSSDQESSNKKAVIFLNGWGPNLIGDDSYIWLKIAGVQKR